MLQINRVQKQIGAKVLSIETGKIAKQADGAVLVQYGDTIVLVAAVTAPPRAEEIDFFPLNVDYREKHSAAGKFPGGFIKREGRPSTKEILTARMIDRPIRPLFPPDYFEEVQIMATVLSADTENDPDVLAIIGASAALSISKIPFDGPIGVCRFARVNGQFIVSPTYKQVSEADLNLLLGGKKDALNMIEVAANELPEEIIVQAVAEAHKTILQICEMIEELTAKANPQKEIPLTKIDPQLYQQIRELIEDKLRDAKQIPDKQKRNAAVKEIFQQVSEEYCPGEYRRSGNGNVERLSDESRSNGQAKCGRLMLKRILDKIEQAVVRKLLLEGKRPDGRDYDSIRDISCEVGILPRTHGSAMFTRGETQAIVSITLGTIRDAQIIDGLLEEYAQSFTLHYNFPPFSVGEVRPIRGPGRREIGHGALAEKALMAVRPPDESFAYTVRVVSDITESNGSSSMAAVCAGSLALMDAGVPIKAAVAGISIGMVSDENKYHLLTDIIGEEDHFGDMDFKIAGTEKGITAIQLDIKMETLPQNILAETLEKARQARLEILKKMAKTISKPREELSKYAPKLISIEIDPELIGKVIGPGGKMIKSIQEQTHSTIEIEEDGTIYISCLGGDGHLAAKELIEILTQPPQVGKIYQKAKVVSVKDFGVFVEFLSGVEGLCHISELSSGFVKNVEEVCRVGDLIDVKLLSIDDQGRFKLSRKAALADAGAQNVQAKPQKDSPDKKQ